MALLANGSVMAWGENGSGQTNVPLGLSNVVAIAAGADHNVALKNDGTVVVWGQNAQGQANIPAALTNVIAIAAGASYSLALIGDHAPPSQVPLLNANASLNGFSFVLPSLGGRVYLLQYENNLTDSNWTSMPLVPGNGSNLTLVDPSSTTNTQRFYRVQKW